MKARPERRRRGASPLFATIVARNFHARAAVFARSLFEWHPDARLVILVTDGTDDDRSSFDDDRIQVLVPADLPLAAADLHRMMVMYDVLEFSTALKASLLRLLLDAGHAFVSYVDPDTRVYAPFDEIAARAVTDDVVLVPHALSPFPRDGREPTELTVLRAGAFNLGFIAVGQGARPFLDWWHERLLVDSVNAPFEGLFTDQRWIDLVPTLFKHSVCRDPGMNVAFWNVHERSVTMTGGRPLTGAEEYIRFFHFSGFDPATPQQLSQHCGHRPRVVLEDYPDLALLCRSYADELRAEDQRTWSLCSYRLDWLPNGFRLEPEVRRLYRAAVLSEDDRAPQDPFANNGDDFQAWLLSTREIAR